MGKSFNDDVFNNRINIDSINGLNISQEAIEENKQTSTPKIDLSNLDLDKYKKEVQEQKEKEEKDPQLELEQLKKVQEGIKDRTKEYVFLQDDENKTIFVKRTMIFNQDYLDIIDGLHAINDMEIKEILNQLLEKGISQLDEKTRDKALKTGAKARTTTKTKSIF